MSPGPPRPKRELPPRLAALLMASFAPIGDDESEWEQQPHPGRKPKRKRGKRRHKPKCGRGGVHGKRPMPAESRGKRPANFRWRKRR